MAQIDSLLKQMVELGSSDMHLSVGQPPRIRAKGDLKEMGSEPLNAEVLKTMLYEILQKEQIEFFEKNLDLDFAYAAPGVARFRGNLFYKTTGIGAVFRQIPYKILT